MIATLGIATLVLYVDNKRTRDCIATYMTADQQNTSTRAALQEEERLAFLGTMQIIFNPEASPLQRKEAGEDYIALVLKNNELRKKSPILQVPTSCS